MESDRIVVPLPGEGCVANFESFSFFFRVVATFHPFGHDSWQFVVFTFNVRIKGIRRVICEKR